MKRLVFWMLKVIEVAGACGVVWVLHWVGGLMFGAHETWVDCVLLTVAALFIVVGAVAAVAASAVGVVTIVGIMVGVIRCAIPAWIAANERWAERLTNGKDGA